MDAKTNICKMEIKELITYMANRIHYSMMLFLGSKESIPVKEKFLLPEGLLSRKVNEEELIIFMLALLPHFSPQT
ncbi:MAG: hypothetical protein LIP01_14350, partial [Tannerellaceae bacterium]|nr:hypothetical protein [Tannerellaceae bacterium]